jgi:hypothetical protein
MTEPAKRLAQALICQAIRDMLSTSKVDSQDRVQAWEFLTATSGAWRESRELICDRANLCPNRLRKNFIEFHKSGKSLKDLMRLLEENRV